MFWLITVVIGVGTFCWWLYSTKYIFWKKQNVPGPFPLPIVGNALRFIKGPMCEVDTEDFKKYGPIFGIYTGPTPSLMVNDPEIIKMVTIRDAHIFQNRQHFPLSHPLLKKMLTSLRGEEWKKGRKVVSPVFTTGKLKKMYPIMEKCAIEALDAFSEQKINEDINMKEFWGYYALTVIAKCGFATDLNAFKDRDSEFLKQTRAFFANRLPVVLSAFLPRKVAKALKLDIGLTESLEYYSNVVGYLLKKREEDGNSPADFLKLLVDAKREAAEDSDSNFHELVDDDFIKAQSVLFFLAGYDTTATLLAFTSYTLALHQDVQEKLHETLNQLKETDGGITYENLISCKYLDAVISETLRYYPPSLRVERIAEEEYTIPGTTIKIPKGGMVIFNPYCLHHSPDHYPDSEVFNPERFMPENAENLVPHTYLPFGSGPRNCIAMRFALLEAKIAIAKTVLHYQFVKTKNTRIPLEFARDLIMLKAKSLKVGIEKRT